MLHIALAPAAVAGQEGLQAGGRLFVASGQGAGHVHAPPLAAQIGGLDGVMAHHMAAQGLAAGQDRKAAGLGEGADTDNGVVAEVGRLRAGPPGQARGGHAPVEPDPELLDALVEGLGVDDGRRGLDQARPRIALHGVDQVQESVAGHQAVGVEDDHVRIGAAEPADPVGDVSRLALRIGLTAAVEGPAGGAQAEAVEGGPFGFRRLGAGGVGQDEEVEGAGGVEIPEALVDPRQAGEGGAGVLVVEGHQQRRADQGPSRMLRELEVVPVAADDLQDQAGEGAAEPPRQRNDQGREQAQGDDLEGREAVLRIDPRRGQEGEEGEPQGRSQHDCPAQGQAAGAGDRRRRAVLGQTVPGHVQGGLSGKPDAHGRFAGPDAVRGRAELPAAKTVHRAAPLPRSTPEGRGSQTRYVAAPHMQ